MHKRIPQTRELKFSGSLNSRRFARRNPARDSDPTCLWAEILHVKLAKKKEMLLVGSKTKDALRGGGKYNVSSDAIDAINDYAYWLIEQAQQRCKANGRKTIRNHDILAGCK